MGFELTLANWPPVARLLIEKVSEWFVFFCLVHKVIIGFAVVNVINGVFMQKTFKVAADDDHIMMSIKERNASTHRAKMTKVFNRGDMDRDGFLDGDDFQLMLSDPVLRNWLASMELQIHDIGGVFNLIAGEDQKVSLEE